MREGWIVPWMLLLAGCGEPTAPPAEAPPLDPAARGEALFRAKVGGLSCLDCHSTTHEDQPDPARRRAGHAVQLCGEQRKDGRD